ncbi:MAG: CBS domain-containing protein [Candidatus Nanopelagicales bacterium]|jgi:CBS domain-containing protein|nr:CBS domain-containing protein [Candidatus Nanopelagicales bacterium]MDP4715470.1 CBS domain-containing protein [Candidatus Nanopelagicales bacterium]MDP4907793.1 CBS domain-containing protein [Candidatus Nanopelagicales bacterium]MDP4976084.1 CBS domain-containing protein [Candidatus Nanopelagicales bacterium]MDP5095392.1 CBS domain-containing protein [Candidatus Nanopelagicales bacterium]
MKISAILASKGSDTVTITPDATVASLIHILAEHRIGAVVVSPDSIVIAGIVSERDVVRAMAADPDAGTTGGVRPKPVSEIMTTDVATISPDDTVDAAMHFMTEGRFRHLPVAVEGVLVGIVSIGDIVKARLDSLEQERAALVDYVTRGG